MTEWIEKKVAEADCGGGAGVMMTLAEYKDALSEARQEALREAVEKIKIKGDMGKLTPFQQTVNTYIHNRGVEILTQLQASKE